MPLGLEVGLGPVDFVLDGDPAPSPKRGRSPQILGPCLLWPNGWMDQDGTWHGGRPQIRRLCIRWGPSLPSAKKGAEPPPQFSAHFYCGQTAGCVKMLLGMEVDLSLGDFVLDGDPKFSAHVYYSYYRQHCAQRKPAGNLFTQTPILRFFAPQGRHVAPMGVKFGKDDGTKGPLLQAKIHPHRCNDRGVGPKTQIFTQI